MKLKKIMAALLSATIVCGLIVGCGNGGQSKTEKQGGAKNQESTQDEDIYTVRVWGFGDASTDELTKVSEAISEITREKIGVNVELYRSIDSEKLNLALTSGEKLDLVFAHNLSTNTIVASGLLQPLDELFEEYAPEAAATVKEEDLSPNYFDDKLYFLPHESNKARQFGFAMRKDIVEELGIDATTIKSMEDMHDVLMQVKKAHPEIYPLVPSWAGGGMQRPSNIDNFSSGLAVLGDIRTDSTTVTSLYETTGWQEFVNTMYQWQKEGLVMPDAPTNTDNNPVATLGFAKFESMVPGVAVENYQSHGTEVVVAPITDALKTSDVVLGKWGISAGCERPDKAMQLWNLMYTDPEVACLFTNGIEGQHYEYTDDTKTFITLPEGKSDTGYTSVWWCWPNPQLNPVWDGGEADLWDQVKKYNDTALVSPALGFTFDPTPVMNEITACQNVQSKYETSLQWGMLNPEETIPVFLKELETAGLETIKEEAQKQLDEWLAGQKN